MTGNDICHSRCEHTIFECIEDEGIENFVQAVEWEHDEVIAMARNLMLSPWILSSSSPQEEAHKTGDKHVNNGRKSQASCEGPLYIFSYFSSHFNVEESGATQLRIAAQNDVNFEVG